MRLLDIIKKRYSAREFENIQVNEEKLNYILDCALAAPSKQSIYPYEIHVLGHTKLASEIKDHLVWNDTWCVKGYRARTEDKKSNEKVYNLQYGAPIVLAWTNRNINEENYNTREHSSKQLESDIYVSASFALLAAEEIGLQTCFGRCHDVLKLANMLGRSGHKCLLTLSIGYANQIDDLNYYKKVKRNGFEDGWTIRNVPQHFPSENHEYRSNAIDKDKLVNYI